MTDVRELIRTLQPSFFHQLHFGTFADSATDLNDALKVILPEFDENYQWGPCRWQSRDATSLPNRGDECLVAFNNRRNLWVVSWWPF